MMKTPRNQIQEQGDEHLPPPSDDQFPQPIRISLRPHCSLYLVSSESTGSESEMYSLPSNKEFHCDFCSKSKKGDKLCCYLCNFQICTRCSETLVRYQQGREHIQHFSHQHPLFFLLDIRMKANCSMCLRLIDGQSYGCSPCRFIIHKSCSEMLLQVQHPFHPRHSLVLVKTVSFGKYYCDACLVSVDYDGSFGLRYRCLSGCGFNLHPECLSQKPNIKYLGHPHLVILVENMSHKSSCRTCGFDIKATFFLRCVECSFDFHVQCGPVAASLPPIIVGENHHSHPLTLITPALVKHEFNLPCCDVCKEDRNSEHPSYGCVECDYYTHVRCVISDIKLDGRERYSKQSIVCDDRTLSKSCADDELRQQIQHSFHPRHSLTLQANTSSKRYSCDACRLGIDSDERYRCNECDFDLHLECAALEQNIKYQNHPHPVILVENMSCHSKCETCLYEIKGTFFLRCVECSLDFHVLCSPVCLPPTVVSQHHNHHLTLTIGTIVKHDSDLLYCDVCKDDIVPDHPSYSCVECEYHAHVRCVVSQMIFDVREKLVHFSHKHSLFHVRNQSDDLVCSGCKKLILHQESAYGCDHCSYYLHRSCFDLPMKIQHFFHRYPLTLKSHPDQDTKYHQCGACNQHLQGFFYQCDNCFVLDLDCASLQYQVKHQASDDQILSLFLKSQHVPECRKYISASRVALDQSCVQCNVKVYLLRSPLPRTIQCTSHHHSLTLMDIVCDDNYEIHVCDVCEDERDPGLSVYSCSECDFIAELDCVISEVILALQKNPRDIPLRRIGRKASVKAISKSFAFKDLVDSFTDEERKKLDNLLKDFNEENEEIRREFYGVGQEAKGSRVSDLKSEVMLYSSPVFYQEDRILVLEDEDCKRQLVDVGSYKTIPRLAGTLKSLLDKYGDIGATCNLPDSNLKTYLMVRFSSTLHSMCSTMIQDVNYDLLCNWWRHFNLVRRTGFDIEFIFVHLKQIAGARRRIDTDHLRNSSIHYPYEQMAKLCKEIDILAGDIDERMSRMDIMRKQTQAMISDISFQRLRLETQQLSEAREDGLMKAGKYNGLL